MKANKRNWLPVIILFFLFTIFPPASRIEADSATEAASPLKTIYLTEAIRSGLVNNPDMNMALSRIRKSEALIEKAASPFYPSIDVYTNYIQGDAPSAYLFNTLDQRKFEQGTSFNDPGWFENYESGARLNMNIFNGGRDLLNHRMAESSLSIRKSDHQAIRNTLVATIVEAYFNALSTREFIATANASVGTVSSQLETMKIRYAAGGALRSDVLSLEVRLAQAKEEVLRSNNAYKISLAALERVTGLPLVNPVLPETADIDLPDIPEDMTAGIAYALSHRPEIASAQERIRQSEINLSLSKTGYLPKIDFQTRYYMDDPDMQYNTNRDNWTAGVYASWNLFSGFSTPAETRQALAMMDEIRAADKKLVDAITFDVKKSYLDLEAAEKRLQVTETAVANAQESLYLVKQQYDGGSATITRYLETELALNRSRINRTATFFDHQKAKAEIGRAVGIWFREQHTNFDAKE